MKKEIIGYIGSSEKSSVIIKNALSNLERWVSKKKYPSINIDKKVRVKIEIEEV